MGPGSPRPPALLALLLPPLGWLAGVAAQLQQPALWPAVVQAALLALALLLLLAWLGLRRGQAWAALIAVALATALLGFAGTAQRAEQRLQQRLPHALEGVDLWVSGRIVGLPQAGPSGLRFTLAVDSAQSLHGDSVQLPPLLALSWWSGHDGLAWFDGPPQRPRAGERWRLPLRLKRPHAALNPQGFDAELWWFERGIGATGQVRVLRGAAAAQRLDDSALAPVDGLRERLRDGIQQQVGDVRLAGVLAALVVGDQAAIERDDWALFRQTGVAHLVSISGVHITMLAWLAAAALRRVWRWRPAWALMLPAPLAARWGGVLVAAAYALLAGWGVPAQRTLLMLTAAAALRQAGWRWPWPLVLLAAAVVVTALDPWALLQPGFWLSFAAVGLLMASEPAAPAPAPASAAPARPARPARLSWLLGLTWSHLRGQAVASLALAPLSLLFFQQLSLVGLLANLLAIPFVTLLVTPLALAGALWSPLWSLSAALLQAGIAGLEWMAGWPGAVWQAAAAPAWAVAAGLLGAVLAVLPLPGRLRWLALPLLLPLLAPVPPRPASGRFELLAADVGQGTAVLVRTRGHLLLYDAGPAWGQPGRDPDAGQRVLLPLLRARGERRIDVLLLSHRDSDHVGGAASLLAELPVGELLSTLEPGHALRQPGPGRPAPAQRDCAAGHRWRWDGVDFEILHPLPADLAASAPAKANALSCVLRVQDASGRSALLSGDIEAAQEAALLARAAAAGRPLASSVLVVPHHGSKTSSTAAFLEAVAPGVAVVQAGYRSRFGHPAAEVLQRLQQRGIPVQRSDRCGAWHWPGQVDADPAVLDAGLCERQRVARYWHDRPAPGP